MTMKAIRTIKVGRKQVKVYHDNFRYHQPNIHQTTDCTIRAICKVTGMTWLEAFDELMPFARKSQLMPSDTDCLKEYMASKGFAWNPFKAEKGSTRPKVAEFAQSHKGTGIMSVAGHVVAFSLGFYYDIWDCGDKSLYGYWIKNE